MRGIREKWKLEVVSSSNYFLNDYPAVCSHNKICKVIYLYFTKYGPKDVGNSEQAPYTVAYSHTVRLNLTKRKVDINNVEIENGSYVKFYMPSLLMK